MWNRELQRLHSSISDHYLISCVASFTISLTLSRLFFCFPFNLVACLMSHSCSWQWVTLATLPHCSRVVNLFLGWQVEVSVTYLKGPFHPIQQRSSEWAAMYGNRLLYSNTLLFGSLWNFYSRLPPNHMCTHEMSRHMYVRCRRTVCADTHMNT